MGPVRALKLGTRGSPLALWQANHVAGLLRAVESGIEVEIVTIRTLAEKFPEKEVAEIGSGIFTREIDEALIEGRIDVAVHSLKDVPSEIDPRLALAAVPGRENPLDAFISRDGTRLLSVPRGSRIGTGSPRRRSQILHARPDVEVVPLRGNVATRIAKVETQGLAGTVLACAGLRRLGQDGRITELIDAEVMTPAVSQGALGVIARRDDPLAMGIARAIDHGPSRLGVSAERGFLRTLRGGCLVPAGALATPKPGGKLRLVGVIAAPDGTACYRGALEDDCPDGLAAEGLGLRLARDLLGRGGAEIIRGLAAGDRG